jgi:ROS/MUCR transcriptional regulator protein
MKFLGASRCSGRVSSFRFRRPQGSRPGAVGFSGHCRGCGLLSVRRDSTRRATPLRRRWIDLAGSVNAGGHFGRGQTSGLRWPHLRPRSLLVERRSQHPRRSKTDFARTVLLRDPRLDARRALRGQPAAGEKFKSLKRHLRTKYNLTPDEYRARWNLPSNYPMVAPNYAQARSALAKTMGLGQKRAATRKRSKKAA